MATLNEHGQGNSPFHTWRNKQQHLPSQLCAKGIEPAPLPAAGLTLIFGKTSNKAAVCVFAAPWGRRVLRQTPPFTYPSVKPVTRRGGGAGGGWGRVRGRASRFAAWRHKQTVLSKAEELQSWILKFTWLIQGEKASCCKNMAESSGSSPHTQTVGINELRG